MAIISLELTKDSNKTEAFLSKAKNAFKNKQVFKKYGEMGVEALRKATPRDTGKTSESWYYEVKEDKGGVTIEWSNRNINKYINVAVIIQYGHGTGTGGYVKGIDYINPAMRPVFDDIVDGLWKEVTK